jgi:hypothetical protein
VFGFIAAPCPRCSHDGAPVWRSAFCGLARCLGRDYGEPARLLVNRDAAFMGLLGMSLDPQPVPATQGTCCNPFARPFAVVDHHPAVRHAAAVSVCGLAVKLADDSRDEGLLRRGASRLGRHLTGAATDRAVAHLNRSSFPTAEVMAGLDRQEEVEVTAPDRADEPTAAAYGMIVAHLAGLTGVPSARTALERTGRALGSLVYWRDAWIDQAVDAKRGRFNPFAVVDPARIHARIRGAWRELGDAMAALPVERHGGLLAGVLRTTANERGAFLELRTETAAERREARRQRRERRRAERQQKGGSWWQDCCDCSACCDCGGCAGKGAGKAKGGCCDAAFDCGPGDSGCCDCCPCDGCNCCP